MERKKLANDVTDFCFEYGVFNTTCGANEIKKRIEEQFIDPVFVKGLIGMITDKVKLQKNVDIDKMMELLLELDSLRAELEYKEQESSGQKC